MTEWFVTEYSGRVRVLLEFFGSAALSVGHCLSAVCAVSDGPGSRPAPGGRHVWEADRWTLFVREASARGPADRCYFKLDVTQRVLKRFHYIEMNF